MSTLHRIRFAYLQLRHRVRMRLIGIERAKARKFLAMPVTGKPSTWPKLNENHSVDRFRRENGR